MKIKRLISIIIVFVICLSFSAFPCMDVSADEYGLLYELGIMEKNIADKTQPVTRLEMLTYAVKLCGSEISFSKGETPFADVPMENDASGYVNYAVSRGIISASEMFCPDRTVKYEEALKMIVSALDYSEIAKYEGGYPAGFMNVAQSLGITDGIVAGEGNGLTVLSVETMLYNALFTNVCNGELIINNQGEANYIYNTDSDEIVMGKRFNVSKYYAFITDYKSADGILSAEIISNKRTDNNLTYKAGDRVNLEVGTNIQLGDIKYTYADIYVHNSEKVVWAEVSKKTQITLGYIYEVNESHKNAPQNPLYIENIGLENSEDYIDVSENCKMYFNGEETKLGEVYPYIGAFARAVIYSDEIIALEAWSMTEGGIVTRVGDNEIEYMRGETPSSVLTNISEYNDVNIFINGLKSELWALTEGTQFDVFVSEDKESIMIVASTRAITSSFDTMSEKGLTIGGEFYPLSEQFDVYYAQEENVFAKNIDPSKLLDRVVTVYLDYAGYIRYVTPVLEDLNNKEYYGIVLGYNQVGLSEPELLVYLLDDGIIKKSAYKLTQKVSENQKLLIENIKDEIERFMALDETSKNSSLKNFSFVYKIKLNSQQKIMDIKPASYFSEPILNTYYATGQMGYRLYDFSGDAKANTSTDFKIYFDGADICVLYYNEDDGIVAKTTTWDDLKLKSSSELFLTPFAEPGSSEIDLMLIRGDIEGIGYGRPEFVKKGLVTNFMTGYDKENGKEVISLEAEGKVYTVSKYKDQLAGVTDAAYIIYGTDNPFLGKDEIRLNTVVNLSGEPEQWSLAEPHQTGLHKDEIEKIDSRRAVFTSGDAWYLGENVPVYEIVETNGKVKFIKSLRGNIPSGCDAWYILSRYEISALFYR